MWNGASVATLLQGKIYAVTSSSSKYQEQHCSVVSELYCTMTDLSSWTKLAEFDLVSFGLSTYQLQLVMLGGENIRATGEDRKVINDVLLSKDGITWEPLLPSMPTRRSHPAVVNTGNPEYLVVAGGFGQAQCASKNILDVVEVFIEGQWFAIKPLLAPSRINNYCFYDGRLIFNIGVQNHPASYQIIYCECHTLMAHCILCKSGEKPTGVLWKAIDEACNADISVCQAQHWKHYESNIALVECLGGKLLSFRHRSDMSYKYVLFAHSLATRCWVPVGEIPEGLFLTPFAVALGREELAILGECGSVFKASLRGTKGN